MPLLHDCFDSLSSDAVILDRNETAPVEREHAGTGSGGGALSSLDFLNFRFLDRFSIGYLSKGGMVRVEARIDYTHHSTWRGYAHIDAILEPVCNVGNVISHLQLVRFILLFHLIQSC